MRKVIDFLKIVYDDMFVVLNYSQMKVIFLPQNLCMTTQMLHVNIIINISC